MTRPSFIRSLLITTGVIDVSLRALALWDLSKRPAQKVRGHRRAWAIALATVNSSGVLPAIYFSRGRTTT